MAVLTLAQIKTLMLNALAANVTTDAPLSTAEQEDFINDAYADIYEISGGSAKVGTSSQLWTAAESETNHATGNNTTVAEILHLFASQTSGSTGTSSGDNELDRADWAHIQWLRKSFTTGTYDRPKVFAATRMATTTPGNVGILQLDWWPTTATGFYFPAWYRPQFAILDSSTVTTPDVTDIESRDIAIWAACMAAPTIGRAEMVPGLTARMSEHTRLGLERKLSALLAANQDK